MKVILNLSVSIENKKFAIDQFKQSNGQYSSVSHWANETLTRIRKEKEEAECVSKLKN